MALHVASCEILLFALRTRRYYVYTSGLEHRCTPILYVLRDPARATGHFHLRRGDRTHHLSPAPTPPSPVKVVKYYRVLSSLSLLLYCNVVMADQSNRHTHTHGGSRQFTRLDRLLPLLLLQVALQSSCKCVRVLVRKTCTPNTGAVSRTT